MKKKANKEPKDSQKTLEDSKNALSSDISKDEVELFDKSYMENDAANKPPYFFIGLIIFVILSFLWKHFVVK